MTGELLLELLSEEIPARMQLRAIDDLVRLVGERLAGAGLAAVHLQGYVTPRRLTVIAEGIPARQPDRSEERRGPRVGAPQPAIDGFLRAAGLAALDQCEIRESERGAFYFAVLRQPGRETAAVLPELIHGAIAALPWPKSMRFPASRLRWVRPLNSAICLFDGHVVNLPLDAVPVGRVTEGHRFLSPGPLPVADAADYRAKLEAAYVVLDPDRRRALIAADLDRLAATEGLRVKLDPGLLDEVTGLVEYPVVLMGAIDADFVRPLPDGLPPEVLATAMRAHQKYFTCLNPDGSPAPRFLFVANNRTPDGGRTIAAGNERVLRARLADARFFWDQDRKVRLESRVAALKERVYHEKLGSMFDKAERMAALAEYLAESVPGADPAACRRAALLAKADLSTGMVGEFPELQGIMGRYYARGDGEDPRVADPIADHYKPLGPNDTCPTAPDSIAVALADKIDALAAFFSVGEKPTGSGDPFALRRAAQGVIRIILESELRLSLRDALAVALEEPVAVTTVEVIDFIFDRLRVHVRDQGVSADLIVAARRPIPMSPAGLPGRPSVLNEADFTRFMRRVRALQSFLATGDGSSLLIAYRRAQNIVRIEEERDRREYGQEFQTSLLRQEQERSLAEALIRIGTEVRTALDSERFESAMASLARLRRPVDEFFDNVTVNTDAESGRLRANRLKLLTRIRNSMNQVADFSQIEG